MRATVLFLVVVLMAVLVHSTPINPKRLLINRPQVHNISKRFAQIKGERPGVKGHSPSPHLNLRKGEFMCGNRVCKLQPGVVPKNCNGVCQYPL